MIVPEDKVVLTTHDAIMIYGIVCLARMRLQQRHSPALTQVQHSAKILRDAMKLTPDEQTELLRTVAFYLRQ